MYKNNFNYTFDYEILNNKQLVQISEIENQYVKFWIDRLKLGLSDLKTIEDFDKWFYSIFKNKDDDIKYEFYKNITDKLEK